MRICTGIAYTITAAASVRKWDCKGVIIGFASSSLASMLWASFEALGDIAFPYSYSFIVLEIQWCTRCIYADMAFNPRRVLSSKHSSKVFWLTERHPELCEMKNTLKSPASENTMKKASTIAVVMTTGFFLCCGCFGYAAFGDDMPGNLLTEFGFYEPYWLIDIANACVVLHLVGGYQDTR